jgi:glutathione S-transferase
MSLVLHGFRYSVYVRIARIALAEKGLTYENVEIDPFATDVPIEYLTLHPFKRVPVLVDGDCSAEAFGEAVVDRLKQRLRLSGTRTALHCAYSPAPPL